MISTSQPSSKHHTLAIQRSDVPTHRPDLPTCAKFARTTVVVLVYRASLRAASRSLVPQSTPPFSVGVAEGLGDPQRQSPDRCETARQRFWSQSPLPPDGCQPISPLPAHALVEGSFAWAAIWHCWLATPTWRRPVAWWEGFTRERVVRSRIHRIARQSERADHCRVPKGGFERVEAEKPEAVEMTVDVGSVPFPAAGAAVG